MKRVIASCFLVLVCGFSHAQEAVIPLTAIEQAGPEEVGKLIGPGKFSITLRDVSLEEAIAKVAALPGVKVEVTDRAAIEDERVTLALKNVSFWAALDAVLRKAEATYVYKDGKITVLPKRDRDYDAVLAGPMPVFESGPFTLRVQGITRAQRLYFSNIPAEEQAIIDFKFLPDPRLVPPSPYRTHLQILETRDDKGHELIKDDFNMTDSARAGYWRTVWNVGLKGFAPESKSIALLRGEIDFPSVFKKELWTVPLPLEEGEETLATKTTLYHVWPLRKTETNYEMKVKSVFVDEKHRADYLSDWLYYLSEIDIRDIKLEDLRGNKYEMEPAISRAPDDRDALLLKWKLPTPGGQTAGEPARMIWNVATDIRIVKIPFEFKDLPLP